MGVAWRFEGRGHAHGHLAAGARGGLEMGHVMLLLPLHAAVLEPDLDLSLAEIENVRDLYAPAPRQVAVEVELFFQLKRLVSCVRRPGALAVRPVSFRCRPQTTNNAHLP